MSAQQQQQLPAPEDSERAGADSASSAYRRRGCVGSSNLIRALRDNGTLKEPEASDSAASGTLVHRAWSGEAVTGLTAMQADTLATLQRMEQLVLTDWAGNDQYTLLGREKRLWLHQDLEPVHSGQFDVAYGTISTHRMLILDGKTLFSEVEPAWTNDQMRELVALARFNYPAAEEFTVAILQPWVSQRPTIAVYDAAEAELALRLLRLSIADASDPDAPRTAGRWCKYCPALAHCDQARGAIGNSFRLAKQIETGEFAIPIGERGTKVLDSLETAKTALRALEAAYKKLLEQDPDCVPGWYLKAGNHVREIEDIAAAHQIAVESGLSTASFLDCAKVSITALQSALGAVWEVKGKRLEDGFNRSFDSVIISKQNAPSLARTSPTRGRHKELTPNPTEQP